MWFEMSRGVTVRIHTESAALRDIDTDGTIKVATLSRSELSVYVAAVVNEYLDLLSPNLDPPMYVYYYPGSYAKGTTILDVMISGTPPAKIGEICVTI
jgi:hypothetical protein